MLNCTLTPDKIDPEHRIVEQEGKPTTAPKQEHIGCRSSIPTEDQATAAVEEEEGRIERTKRMTTHQPAIRITSGEHEKGHRNIMIPVDDTEDSAIALRWAIDNVYQSGDTFHLLHVVPEPKMVHVWVGMYVPPDESAELEEIEYTKDFCKHRFVSMLSDAKVPFDVRVVVGPTDSESISHVIARKCDELSATIVVMARHSKGSLKEMWVGSVTKQLLRKANIPVAIVPHI